MLSTLLDLHSNLQRSFSFDDAVTFQGKALGAPWSVTSFAVDEAVTPHQIAVAGHLYWMANGREIGRAHV